MTIRVVLERDSVLNGENVRGRAEWVSSSNKEPRKIEIVCRWRTTGRANKTVQVLGTKTEDNIGSRKQVTIPFEFAIPIDGPLSYEGKQFGIVWEIIANVDLPMAFDEDETKVFTVRPRPYDREEFTPEDEEDDEDYDEDEDEDEDDEDEDDEDEDAEPGGASRE